MESERLKKGFGDKLRFWGGGVDTQHTLPDGSLDEIRQQVIERIKIFVLGGGFVFKYLKGIPNGSRASRENSSLPRE